MALKSLGVILVILAMGLPTQAETRSLQVLILADEEFREIPGWQLEAENEVKKTLERFEKEVGLSFTIQKISGWQSNDDLTELPLLAEELDNQLIRHQADIVIALTGQDNLKDNLYGYALFREGLVMMKRVHHQNLFQKYLKHELGHLFGAVHVINPHSLMDAMSRGDEWDDRNKEIIDLNRKRTFNRINFPLPKENWDRIMAIYQNMIADLEPSLSEWKEKRPDHRIEKNLEGVHILLAQLQIEKRNYDSAMEESRQALRLDPDNPEPRNLLGICLRKKGLLEEAIQTYEDILRVNPRQARVLFNLGIAYSKKGDLAQALASYRQAIACKPNFAEPHCNLSDIHLRQGQIDLAEKEIQEALALHPSYGLAISNLAEVYFRKNEFQKSEETANQALACDPTMPEPYNILGNIGRRQGKMSAALYSKALELDPFYEKTYYNLGTFYLDQGERVEAEKNFLKALEINPRFAEALSGLGYCYLVAGRIHDAISKFQQSLKLGFASAILHLNLSSAYLRLQEFDRALDSAQKSIAIDPDLAPASHNLGIAYAGKGKIPEAIEQFNRALKTDPTYHEACTALGNLYLQLGEEDRALENYLRAVELGSTDAALHNNLAAVYYNKRQYQQAWKYLKKAQALGFAVHPEFLEALKKKTGR